jgi:hypothetical protein
MKIRTHYDPAPIPLRQFDWCAVDDSTYDGPGCPVGYGATEQEAIDDLMMQVEDDMAWGEMASILKGLSR